MVTFRAWKMKRIHFYLYYLVVQRFLQFPLGRLSVTDFLIDFEGQRITKTVVNYWIYLTCLRFLFFSKDLLQGHNQFHIS